MRPLPWSANHSLLASQLAAQGARARGFRRHPSKTKGPNMHQQSLSPQRVLDYIDRQASTPELEVLRLVAMTGLHPQALLGLKPADMNRVSSEITCSFKGTRGTLRMSHAVLNTLEALIVDGEEFFFARAGQPVEFREVLDHWEALCIAEGLRDEDGGNPKITALRSAALGLFVAELKKDHG